ncbi:MAG: tetratricopeptide repeat protein [Bacteroidota bacterium]|nr:tetratricopeptide repeat protein [Candidatus Kapabacteria bacterium]MDW8220627.1 tetratricopeptide repeat protein [Bacteroidota bacterium]
MLGSISFATTRLLIRTSLGEKSTQAPILSSNSVDQSAAPSSESTTHTASAELEQRIQALQDSLAQDPRNADVLLRLANAWYDAGAFFQAEQHYARYLNEFNPRNVAARVDYAYTILRQGRSDEAIAQTKKALEYDPQRIEAMYNLGVMYYGKKDWKASIEWFERCIATAPATEIAQSARSIVERIRQEMRSTQ